MNIVIIGAGAFGTALANELIKNPKNNIFLTTIEHDVVETINNKHTSKYFANLTLNKKIKATIDFSCLQEADFIFIALPSGVIINFLKQYSSIIQKKSILVNLAKGFSSEGKTIAESLHDLFPHNKIASMKGPTFADELIREFPSALTVACSDESVFQDFEDIFLSTNIHLDFTKDILGVELVSVLKNIYAISIGILDAQYNSANTRFFVLTNAFNEMKKIIEIFNCDVDTIFKYCGFGDFGLTALNDLSRNRTFGLLVGKGFFSDNISSSVILEGRRSLDLIYSKLKEINHNMPILMSLNKLFRQEITIKDFVQNILKDD
ncbi:MAG: NAD(P)H-dependent glycerol-3-phosphate dehydrogenase [Pseudomonadota bacterium]